jgi:hypothetical protein
MPVQRSHLLVVVSAIRHGTASAAPLTASTLWPATQVYANDGTAAKPKWGYVATIPGAVMKVSGSLVLVSAEGRHAFQ